MYYTVKDVMDILGVAQNKAYAIICLLNSELREQGYLTICGKVSKKYFLERYHISEPV